MRQHLTHQITKQLEGVADEIEKEVVEELKDFVHHLDNSKPNMKQLLDYYQTELTKLKDELHADQTVKDIQATLYVLYDNIACNVYISLSLSPFNF